jgi:hypothetical protein
MPLVPSSKRREYAENGIRPLPFLGISGTLNTSGINAFSNPPHFGLELWAWKLRLRSSLERAWCPLCADGLS